MIRVELSEWRCAPIELGGERIFVVGDVHGCRLQLSAWLRVCQRLRQERPGSERLIFLGDIINRGPDTEGAIALWSKRSPIRGIERVHRLMGNHEQLEWLSSQPRRSGWNTLESGVVIGNVVFVHAGVDPLVSLEQFLSIGKDVVPEDGRHWAWIEGPFLTWRHGFGGRIIVHGHTPPSKYREWTGRDDPHVLHDGRLCLDGGSATTGTVAGAQLEDGRYRIVRATIRGYRSLEARPFTQ